MPNLLIVLSGSIAGTKWPAFVHLAESNGWQTRTVVTAGARTLLSETLPPSVLGPELEPHPESLESYFSGQTPIRHIQLARWADIALVFGATANTLAKLTHGIADDLATTTLLATSAPVCVSPAMNPTMWSHPATQANVATLRARGVHFLGPISGPCACGESGLGRLLSPAVQLEALTTLYHQKDLLCGKRVLITAGASQVALDPVRTISARSSGRLGAALATVATQMGAHVDLITSPGAVTPAGSVQVRHATTFQDYAHHAQVLAPQADLIFHATALSDFTVQSSPSKLASHQSHTLTLTPGPKLLPSLRAWAPRAFLCAWKLADANTGSQKAQALLTQHQLQAVVLNSPHTLSSHNITPTVFTPTHAPWAPGSLTKPDFARAFLQRIATTLSTSG